MRHWVAAAIIGVLFIALIGVPVVWRPVVAQQAGGGDDALKLVIITPHNEQIRYEVEHAFSEWHAANFPGPGRGRDQGRVSIDWRAIGGTSDIERQLMSQYSALAAEGRLDDGAGYDIVFGGGDYFFDRRLKAGVGGERILEPLRFEPAFIAQVYPSPTIADKKLYDPEGMWWGVVLSSFGIVYNRDVLAAMEVKEPRTWEDLTDMRLMGWVGMADPSHSGSVRTTYDAILQNYGPERGWATLRRMSANARYFANSSTKVPIDVSAGEAAAGVCIDFYGRAQAEAVGGERMGYIAPADATVITADPVAVLRGAPHRELAERFVRFLLTQEGQAIWALPVGSEGGPRRYALRRPPIRRDMYEPAWMARMIDKEQPFEIARPLPPGTPSYFGVLPTVMHAMAMDVHDELREAWGVLHAETDPRKRAEMEALFDALPFTQEELLASPARWRSDPGAEHDDRIRWTRFFRANYEQIIAMQN